jgi:hypothetical protein
VDEQMRVAVEGGLGGHACAKFENRLDMLPFREDHVGARFDDVVEMKRRAVVGIISRKSARFGPLRIENREHMGHTAAAVMIQLLKAANREQRRCYRSHERQYGGERLRRQ